MQKDIEILLKIQEKDVKAYALKKEAQILPQDLKSVKDKVQDAENKLKERHEETKKIQVAKKDLELDLEAKQENIKKFETQLFQIKTNEEYKAMQKQITDLKFGCGLTEDKILEKMEEIEKSQILAKEAEAVVASVKKEFEEQQKEINKKIEDVKVQIENIQKERDEATKDVSPEFLKRYEVILKNKHGAAIVAVENKTCQGCHMILPPNVINEVKRGTTVVVCDNCARILFCVETQNAV
jgi:predicted  nucleic acid-binding Zn-ribbon protein